MRSFTPNPPALAAQVRATIRRQPRRFDQVHWFGNVWLDNPWLLQSATVRDLQGVFSSPIPQDPGDLDLIWGMTACVGGMAAVYAAPSGSVVSFARQTITLPAGWTYPVREYASAELGLSNLDGNHYLFLPARTEIEVDAALSVIAERTPGRWANEPLWSLTHARLGRPVAERPQM